MRKRLLYVTVLVAVVLWGGSFIVTKALLESLNTFQILFIRFFVASVIFVPFLILRRSKVRWPDRKDIPLIVFAGIVSLGAGYLFETLAVSMTTASNVSLILTLDPIIIALLASFFLGEKIRQNAAYVALAFAGAVLVVLSDGAAITFNRNDIGGGIVIFVSMLCFAYYSIVGKKLVRVYDPFVIMAYMTFIATALHTVVAFFSGGFQAIQQLSASQWLGALYLGGLCTVVAFSWWYNALIHVDVSHLALFVYLIPITTIILSYFVFDERIGVLKLTGALAIILGVWLATRKKKLGKKENRKSPQITQNGHSLASS